MPTEQTKLLCMSARAVAYFMIIITIIMLSSS